jgi:hypothetical protein
MCSFPHALRKEASSSSGGGDDPELASYVRVEEREIRGVGGLN